MDIATILDWVMHLGAWLGFGLLAYGAHLVLGGGGFRRDVPEDAASPRVDVMRFG